jgi:3-oxoadipate enol-lactonase
VQERIESGVYYKISGSGDQTIVLLRGLARWSEHWLDFDARLSEQGFRVIAVDNRGFGRSSALEKRTSFTIDELADDVAQIISREAPSGAHIVALSLGAMIGLSLATNKPQLVRSLMMVNSSVGASGLSRLSKGAILAIVRVILMGRRGYAALAKLLLGPSTPMETRLRLARAWSEIDMRTKISANDLWKQLRAARQFVGLLEMSSIHCPVTIVRCDGDQFVDPRNSDFIHNKIEQSVLIRHHSAGHELAVDDPDWFLMTIKNSIQKSTPHS